MIERIKTVTDLQTLVKLLISECLSFHPNDAFKDYILFKENKPCYTNVDAEKRSSLMRHYFDISERDGFDIYSIMLEVSLKEKVMYKYIPLPSSIGEQIHNN